MSVKTKKTRASRIKLVESCYEQLGRRYDNNCLYCGAGSEIMDHVPPVSIAAEWLPERCMSEVLLKIPACRQCNSALGAYPVTDLDARRAFIGSWLRKKYKSLLRMPQWDEDELDELTGQLRNEVKASIRFSKIIRGRIAYTQFGKDIPKMTIGGF